MSPIISIKNLSKSFGTQCVLNDISFNLEKSEILGIVGPSGVGKSVLLKLIMGLLFPDSGTIEISGAEMNLAIGEDGRQKLREQMGILFQSAALLDSLRLYDNIKFPLVAKSNISEKEKHQRVLDIANSLSLTSVLNLYPQQVSLGVRKRAGMARALIIEPKIFLLDEPNTGLDPLVGQEVYDLINDCRKKWNFSGLVISHELPEVFQVCDKIIMLLGGKIIAEGTPTEFEQSSNPAVQQFLNGRIDGPIRIQ
jgi:phospholipid/cholesterol/gamma-HCH transport system ATP-binding protein